MAYIVSSATKNDDGCYDADIEMVDSNADEVDLAETRGNDS